MHVLKLEVSDVGFESFASQGEAPGFDSLQIVGHHMGKRVLRPDCVLASSTRFSVVFSLFS